MSRKKKRKKDADTRGHGDAGTSQALRVSASPRPPVALFALAVGLLTLALYLPSLWSGFVYDAEAQILIGGYIHDPSHFGDVLTMRVLAQDVLDGNRPVQLASLMTDSLLWGKNPAGYHFTSALLHACNAAMLFLLLVRLCGSETRSAVMAALAGAAIFAAHPVLTEPVAEVSSREDLLAGFFLLLALLLAFRRAQGLTAVWTYGGCLLAVLLSCGAKEVGAMAPFLILLCGFLFHRDEPLRRWLWLSAGAFAVAGGFLAARFLLQPEESQIFLQKPTYIGGSLLKVFELQPRIWALSLRTIFWPFGLSADYVPQNVLGFHVAAGMALLVIFVAVLGLASWRSRVAAFGALMFWICLAPVSNFIPIYRPVADRYLYLPLMGLAAVLCGLFLLASRREALFRPLLGVAACVVIVLAGLSVQRQRVFANSLNLWTDAAKASPFSDTAANNLGYALLDKGDLQQALAMFQKALDLSGGSKPNACAGAAVALEKLGRPADALRAVQLAIKLDPVYADPKQLHESMLVTKEQSEILAKILERNSP